MWIEHRLRTRPRGVYGLRAELKQKQIDPCLIDTVLADYDEAEAAWTAIQRRLARWQALDGRTLHIKLSRFLTGRGFRRDTIAGICREVIAGKCQS
jgi:SOS response regulatory protein OraA/RecX